MRAETKGISLIMVSILGLLGAAGGIELMPPEAGLQQWLLVVAMVCGFVSSGLAGISYMKEVDKSAQ